MDQWNALSDDELRQRLRHYGFPNLPVTSTTRSTLIKKLRHHMNNEHAKLKQATSFVTRYSSDEEASDHETKRKRATMPPPKTNSKRSSYQPAITKISPRSSSVYVSPVVRHQHNDDEDDTDHDTNNLNTSFSNSFTSSANSRGYSLGLRTSTPPIHSTSSQNFLSYERSKHGGISQPREAIATSNGHNDDLFANDYSQRFSTHYRRSALSSNSSKFNVN